MESLARRTAGWRTRFAPSPTGYLHRGHLVHAASVWGLARAFGGVVILRMEDHDRVRCKPEFERAIMDDLEWLGLVADTGLESPDSEASPFRQSDCNARYEAAMGKLQGHGVVYPCTCSRRDIALVAGDIGGEEPRYPGTCRDATATSDTFARRLVLPPDVVRFRDERLGTQEQSPSEQCGDLLIRDRRGHWTYQFTVAVDDLAHGVDVIIRGEDLLASTGRQLLVRRMLQQGSGAAPEPLFIHHPLVRHADGVKLSKAAADTGLRELRRAGVRPDMLLAAAVRSLGFKGVGASLSAADLGSVFASWHAASFPGGAHDS
jgi:glutamyl-tRNA synthetase/glutamyl-Q tRNA(Asp) synthetase